MYICKYKEQTFLKARKLDRELENVIAQFVWKKIHSKHRRRKMQKKIKTKEKAKQVQQKAIESNEEAMEAQRMAAEKQAQNREKIANNASTTESSKSISTKL